MIGLIELFKDPYERKARLTPGLLVALPVLVPLVCVYGPRHPLLTAVVGVLGGVAASLRARRIQPSEALRV